MKTVMIRDKREARAYRVVQKVWARVHELDPSIVSSSPKLADTFLDNPAGTTKKKSQPEFHAWPPVYRAVAPYFRATCNYCRYRRDRRESDRSLPRGTNSEDVL